MRYKSSVFLFFLIILSTPGINLRADSKGHVYFLEGTVIIENKQKLAIVYEKISKDKGTYHTLKEGDKLGIYTVKKIKKDKIILAKGDKEWVLPLHGAFKGEVVEVKKEPKKVELREVRVGEEIPPEKIDEEKINERFRIIMRKTLEKESMKMQELKKQKENEGKGEIKERGGELK
ncbi:hypothetical protein DRO38_06685 [Candidatus Bathyarchaeota archaeon]|nr:MAG: hypothetical protein DRO38_06685 [Candidatus Bathyarchaeota archaeon]